MPSVLVGAAQTRARWSCIPRVSVVVLGAFLAAGSGTDGVSPILAAGTDQIYVAETNQILRVNDMTGAGRTTMGTFGTGVGKFSALEGIFVDGAGGRCDVGEFMLLGLRHRSRADERIRIPGCARANAQFYRSTILTEADSYTNM